MAELDVVVVGYRSGEDFDRLVEDLPRACALSHRLHYFDNTGNPKTLTRCWNEMAAKGNAPWIAFLNTDIRLSPEWDGRLVRLLEERPGIGAACPEAIGHGWPRLLDAEAASFPDPATAPAPPWEAMVRIAEMTRNDERVVTWGRQCNAPFFAVIVERSIFDELKGFDERFRYYAQDHDFQRRLLDRHGKVAARIGSSRVWHRAGGSRRQAEKLREVNFGNELRHFGTIKSALSRGDLVDWDHLSESQREEIRVHPVYSRMPLIRK